MLAKHFVQYINMKYKLVSIAIFALALTTASLFVINNRHVHNERDADLSSRANLDPTSSGIRTPNQTSIELHQECGNNDNSENDQNRVARFGGISFTYNLSIAAQIKMETVPASPLEIETDKADIVAPEQTRFTLLGTYAQRRQSSFFSPQIDIYRISDYRSALSKSASYTQQFDNEIWTLRTLLTERPAFVEKEIPFLPFGVDAIQSFRARIRYIDFNNGRGIMFLTQYNIEPSLINNTGLVYIFQGLTDDNLHYVSATFPVAAPSLPNNMTAIGVEDYRLPEYFYNKDYALNEQKYLNYLTKIKGNLEKLSASKYEPNLTLFERLVSTLCITTAKSN